MSPPSAGDPDLADGSKVDQYTILGKLGAGGCATVYLAQEESGRRVALKILRNEWVSSDEMLRRFLFEISAVKKINHPGIVEVYNSGLLPDGRPYFTMEYLDGVTLIGYATLHGRFSPAEALELLEPVCAALSATHAAGIVHRDLKGSNILVMPNQTPRVVKLVDFGIAKFLYPDDSTPALTRIGTRLGTPSTMSPEQLRGQPVDARADVYSLGVILYRLLVGRHPFEARDVTEVERMHLEDPPPIPSTSTAVPPGVDAIVLRCLHKDRDQRFPTVEAIVEALRKEVGPISPSSQTERQVPALALYVEARMNTEGDEDEELLNDFAVALDLAEQAVRGAGLQLPLVTGNGFLALQLLDEDLGKRHLQYDVMMKLATGLFEAIEERPTKHPGLHVNISLHFDQASVKADVAGGAITRVSDWAPKDAVQGIFVSPACKAAIPLEVVTELETRSRSRTEPAT